MGLLFSVLRKRDVVGERDMLVFVSRILSLEAANPLNIVDIIEARADKVLSGNESNCSKRIQLPVEHEAITNLSITFTEESLSQVHIIRLWPKRCDIPLSVSVFPVHEFPTRIGRLFSQRT